MIDPGGPGDPNQLAKSMIDIATGQQPSPVDSRPAAVAPDGEPSHAASIAPERRAAIAKKARPRSAQNKKMPRCKAGRKYPLN
jgi:hypothetical protein